MTAEETTKAPRKDSSKILSKGALARIKLLLDDESKARKRANQPQ